MARSIRAAYGRGVRAIPQALAVPFTATFALASGPFFFLLAAAGLFALSLAQPGTAAHLRAGLADAAAPVLAALAAPVQEAVVTVRGVVGLADLQAENARLAAEAARLAGWAREAEVLRAENARLKALLHVSPEPQGRFVTARVLSDGGQAFARTVLVDAGAADGVEAGQAALGPGGLAGRVLEVGARASRVLLVTDVNAQVPVVVGGQGPRAVLSGTNGGEGTLLYLPPDAAVAPGAAVVTSGEGGLIPPGLPVGRVVAPLAAGQAPRVAFHADFGALTHLRLVALPPGPAQD
ncbi:MAG: rod shape-determining protein MreC, partial [Alphaproteobacteria bacterium]|nr:rod shape-determining protein MreC [Alphaproteobacteria bacterium]